MYRHWKIQLNDVKDNTYYRFFVVAAANNDPAENVKNTIFTIDFLFWHGILCLLRVNKSLKSHQFSSILSLIAFTNDFQSCDEPVNQSALHYCFHSIVCEINWKCRLSWVLCCRSWPGRWVISKSSLNLSSCPFFKLKRAISLGSFDVFCKYMCTCWYWISWIFYFRASVGILPWARRPWLYHFRTWRTRRYFGHILNVIESVKLKFITFILACSSICEWCEICVIQWNSTTFVFRVAINSTLLSSWWK